MKSYEIFEHTADIGLAIYGHTLQELFINAIKGIFFLISPSIKISNNFDIFPNIKHFTIIELKAVTEEELLVYWLNEFVYYFFVKSLFPKSIVIDDFKKASIRARVNFSRRNKNIPIDTEIKAATYHDLHIKRKNSTYQAKVIFDI